METWKTRMKLAFPTFPQGPPRDPETSRTQSQKQTEKEGGLATAIMTKTGDLHPSVSSWRHPSVLVDAGQSFSSGLRVKP